MLEYFSYKKWDAYRKKKAQAVKDEEQRVLDQQDEKYFEKLAEDSPQEIPLEASSATAQTPGETSAAGAAGSTTSTAVPAESASTTTATTVDTSSTGKKDEKKKGNWKESVQGWKEDATEIGHHALGRAKQVQLPAFLQKKEGKDKEKEKDQKEKDKTTPDSASYQELTKEEKELEEVLERLNLAAEGGNAFSLSAETKELFRKFTQILKDMVNGVPTAYDDLIKLFETSSQQIEKLFDNVPGFMKKLITGLPPMAEGGADEKETGGGPFDMAARTAAFTLPALKEFIKKPGMVSATLKSILNVLKTRFPALMGTNALMSMALFMLLFVFWYVYKRGKETRLEKEKLEREEALKTELEKEPAAGSTEALTDRGTASVAANTPLPPSAPLEPGQLMVEPTPKPLDQSTQPAMSGSVPDVSGSSSADASAVPPFNRPPPPEPAASLKSMAQ